MLQRKTQRAAAVGAHGIATVLAASELSPVCRKQVCNGRRGPWGLHRPKRPKGPGAFLVGAPDAGLSTRRIL